MHPWYLIHTKPSSEALALRNLLRQQYEAYLPRIVLAALRATQWHERTAPLFPRYLFLRLKEGEQSLRPVASTLGVASIVRFGSCYAVVPDFVIEELQARADPFTGLHRLSCGRRLAPGSTVKVASGPFDGLEGVFEREAGADRVLILLTILGRRAPVCVPADSIALMRAV